MSSRPSLVFFIALLWTSIPGRSCLNVTLDTEADLDVHPGTFTFRYCQYEEEVEHYWRGDCDMREIGGAESYGFWSSCQYSVGAIEISLTNLVGSGLLPSTITIRSYTTGSAAVNIFKRLSPEGLKEKLYEISNQGGWGAVSFGLDSSGLTEESVFIVETSGISYPNNIDLIDKITVWFGELTSPSTTESSTAATELTPSPSSSVSTDPISTTTEDPWWSWTTTTEEPSTTTEFPWWPTTTDEQPSTTTSSEATQSTTLEPEEPTWPTSLAWTDAPITTDTPVTKPPFCPPTGVHNFPYPGNCTLYIRCFDGFEQVLSCAPLIFDKVDLICKPEDEAVCDEEFPIKCPPSGYEAHPHLSNCSKYYECVNGNAFESECAANTYFDETPELEHCNLAEVAVCHSECAPTGIEFHAIRSRGCKWYKICLNGQSANLQCEESEVYSPVESKCVLVAEYTCPYAM